jgi:hypothetical protein
MSFEIGRTRDEQSTLCSRARDKYEKKAKLENETASNGKYSKFQRIKLIAYFNVISIIQGDSKL